MTEDAGSAVFLDFRAAFPSVTRSFILSILAHMGLPAELLNIITTLYHNNWCWLVVGGGQHPGFYVESGIRQGCPLSPVLFAIVADLLLRRIRRAVPGALTRAYADDIALVLRDWRESAPVLASLLAEYGTISGLELNMDKCVWVDLAETSPALARSAVQQELPQWGGMHFDDSAKYLGVYLGPGRAAKSWEKPMRKYLERSSFWGQAGGGLHVAALAYSVYVLPVLSFVAQLEDLPPGWEDLEARCMKNLVRCPGNGSLLMLLPYLDLTGMPKAFASVAYMAKAAKLRIVAREARSTGGLRVEARSRALRLLESNTDKIIRVAQWRSWLDGSILHALSHAVESLRARGISAATLELQLGGTRPWTRAAARRAQRGLQRAAVRAQLALAPRIAELHPILRRVADRWRLNVLPGRRVNRFLATVSWLRGRAQPRVVAAMLRTFTNCWMSGRRMQNRNAKCMMGCDQEDSIQHYATCRHVMAFGTTDLWLQPLSPEDRVAGFLGVLHAQPAEHSHDVLRRALLTTATYKLHGWWRHHTDHRLGSAAMLRALRIQLREVMAADWNEHDDAEGDGM